MLKNYFSRRARPARVLILVDCMTDGEPNVCMAIDFGNEYEYKNSKEKINEKDDKQTGI